MPPAPLLGPIIAGECSSRVQLGLNAAGADIQNQVLAFPESKQRRQFSVKFEKVDGRHGVPPLLAINLSTLCSSTVEQPLSHKLMSQK